jgi:type I restriction enzyme S subunit
MGFNYQSLALGQFQMPDGWKLTTIEEVAKVNEKAITPKNATPHIRYIDIASVDKGKLLDIQELSFKEAPSRARRVVRDKDSLISTVRPNLEHYMFVKEPEPNTIASTGFAVVSAKAVDPRFLYYYLTSKPFTAYLTQIAESHTSAYPAFNPDVIEQADLLLPKDSDQRAIAHILGSLDDKIELNRRMNKALEATARAIFKSWFVDFDPVRAKVEGRPTGLPDDIAALFPDSFEDSELGEIPKGWEVLPLSEVIDIIGGGTPKTKVQEYWGGDIPWFSVVDAPSETDIFVVDTEKHITQLGVDKSSTKVLRKGTTIISARGTVGKCALVGRPMAMNQSCYGIQGKNGENNYFIYFTVRRQVSDLQRSGHGSVFNTITRDTFKTIRIAYPPTNLTISYEEIVHPLMESVLANLHENVTLASLRDTLLPKLISGELRVPHPEELVETAV